MLVFFVLLVLTSQQIFTSANLKTETLKKEKHIMFKFNNAQTY